MRRTKLRHILAATDVQPCSDTALQVANLLAARDGAHVEIVSVFTPRIAVPRLSDRDPELCCEPRDRRAAAEQFSRVWQQTRARLHLPWPMVFRVGTVPRVIAELARSGGASLVVVGRALDYACGARAPRSHTRSLMGGHVVDLLVRTRCAVLITPSPMIDSDASSAPHAEPSALRHGTGQRLESVEAP